MIIDRHMLSKDQFYAEFLAKPRNLLFCRENELICKI